VADPAEYHSSLTRIDPATNQVVGAPIVTGGEPLVVATGFGAVWTADHDDGTVSRVDPKSATVMATIEVGAAPHSMAVGAGAIWTGNWHDFTLTKIDPTLNRAIGSPIALDFRPGAIVAGDDAVWVAAEPDREEPDDDRVVRLDPVTGAVVETVHAGARVVALALAENAIWVVTDEPDEVLKIAIGE
jgi:YVTN family beta-propeller protein